SSSGTPCTATTPTTSTPAAAHSPGTGARTSPRSKTCSPNSAEPLSQHKLPELPQLNPTPTNTATTNWPAPQPLRNCESQGKTVVQQFQLSVRQLVWHWKPHGRMVFGPFCSDTNIIERAQ